MSYLPRTLDFQDEKGRSLGAAVPLEAGAPVSRWVGPDGSIRRCSIGWKDGPMGPAAGYGHYRWICFEDRDGDGRYENAFRPLSKNLGLSYSQLDMPIEPPIQFAQEPETPSKPGDARNLGALSPTIALRGISVAKITNKSVTLEYLGPGTSADKGSRRIDLPLDQPGEASLAGITVRLTPSGNGKAMLSASGTLDPLVPVPACNGATWRMGDYVPMVNWAFPTW